MVERDDLEVKLVLDVSRTWDALLHFDTLVLEFVVEPRASSVRFSAN